MAELTRTALDLSGGDRFVSLRRPLGLSAFGMNEIVLAPGERGRVHDHDRQEEVYLVWEGVLTILVEGEPFELGVGELALVPPGTRRQLANRSRERVVLVALGGEPGAHVGRDGRAWTSFEEQGPGRPPQEVPLPENLPV
jgi:quercetin dioxygenase-like cupin family protein